MLLGIHLQDVVRLMMQKVLEVSLVLSYKISFLKAVFCGKGDANDVKTRK